MKTRTDIGLFLLQLYRDKQFIELEQEILKLSDLDLKRYVKVFNVLGIFDLSDMFYKRVPFKFFCGEFIQQTKV